MHQNLSDIVRRDPARPILVRIDPVLEDDTEKVVLQYTYYELGKGVKLDIKKLSPEFESWETRDIVEMMADDDWGFRFLIGKEKTNAGPIILASRMIFSPVLFLMTEGGQQKPMHCKKCAEAYVSWFDNQQAIWAEAYHGIWYKEYCSRTRPSRYN